MKISKNQLNNQMWNFEEELYLDGLNELKAQSN